MILQRKKCANPKIKLYTVKIYNKINNNKNKLMQFVNQLQIYLNIKKKKIKKIF